MSQNRGQADPAKISSSDGQLIATFSKNARERIEIRLREYQGRPFVDVRVFYKDGDQYKPTRKGIAIRPNLLRQVLDGLAQAEASARSAGLLE
jgi:hypothetical protein